MKCKACKYFDKDEKTCHRWPPILVNGLSVWPPITEDQWCGEYQPSFDSFVDLAPHLDNQ